MRKSILALKVSLSSLLIWCLFSISLAATTSQQWRNILNQLRKEWRTDEEIKITMEDLWLDTSWYFPKNNTTTNSSNNSSTVKYNNNQNTSQQWRNTLNELKKEWRTDEEIKTIMEDLWLDTSWYFPNSNNKSSNTETVYTSRSCKVYNIEYISNLWAYTSPDLKKREYFVNIDYFKRYIDSKNPQQYNCPINEWRINTFYEDKSNSSERYTAPNWKIYFITNQNWLYTSNELSKSKSFWTINELKNYIKDRNPLIYMWAWLKTSQRTSQTSALDRIYQTIMHWSATEEGDATTSSGNNTTTVQSATIESIPEKSDEKTINEEQKLESSEEANN